MAKALPKTIEWAGDLQGCVRMIDQTLLPGKLSIIDCQDEAAIRRAIKDLQVRGAPAIGVAAAMGVVLGVRNFDGTETAFFDRLDEVCQYLNSARPTAVNLFWATGRMKQKAESFKGRSLSEIKQALLDEAKLIRQEDAQMCRAIGRVGQHLVPDGGGVLTHCNAGALATAEYGTALAVLYAAHEQGRRFSVFADETRPLLQGARLTAWELSQAGIHVTVICDNMAAWVMKESKIDLVITGADRIAANGDVANKIGTYGLAVLAKAHDIPFYVAAPSSTFDLDTPTGDQIPIEERSSDEVRTGFGRKTVPDEVPCYCPAFDVTPAPLVKAIITEKGLIAPVNQENIQNVLCA